MFVCLELHMTKTSVSSDNNVPLKTVQMEFFGISVHILSLKKVLPKCENRKKKFLILLTESQFLGTLFARYKMYL